MEYAVGVDDDTETKGKRMDKGTRAAIERVKKAGVRAPEYIIAAWVNSVSACTILDSTLREIRAVAGAF